MKIHHSKKNNPLQLQTHPGACAVCIGNFDGMHLGHQQLLSLAIGSAKKHGLTSAMLTFDPAPGSFFNHNDNIGSIMSISEKKEFLRSQKLDSFICLKFNDKLASLNPQQFIENILHQQLQAKIIIVGNDFCFGKNRQGNVETLQQLSTTYNYKLIIAKTTYLKEKRISSTWLRQTLQESNLELTKKLLGRNYSVEGIVEHGDKRGREIGFPTANINLKPKRPLRGVFAVSATWHNDTNNQLYYGVANLGTRPSVDGTKTILEVHLFNCSENLYDCRLHVEFIYHIRAEKRFNSITELKTQINTDILQAKKLLKETI